MHKLHVRIADAVIAADQATLDGLLAEVIETFPARARRRPSPLYGCGRDYNQLALDCMAVGLAKVALRRGLASTPIQWFCPAHSSQHGANSRTAPRHLPLVQTLRGRHRGA